MRRRLFESDHPDLATSLEHVAAALTARGRVTDGIKLKSEADDLRRRISESGVLQWFTRDDELLQHATPDEDWSHVNAAAARPPPSRDGDRALGYEALSSVSGPSTSAGVVVGRVAVSVSTNAGELAPGVLAARDARRRSLDALRDPVTRRLPPTDVALSLLHEVASTLDADPDTKQEGLALLEEELEMRIALTETFPGCDASSLAVLRLSIEDTRSALGLAA